MVDDISVSYEELMNVERRPMYILKINDLPLAVIFAGVADKVAQKNSKIVFYKNEEEIIKINKDIR